jgi:hypothetical protein
MQTFSLTTLGLWTGLEDWPHRACLDAVVTEMHAAAVLRPEHLSFRTGDAAVRGLAL